VASPGPAPAASGGRRPGVAAPATPKEGRENSRGAAAPLAHAQARPGLAWPGASPWLQPGRRRGCAGRRGRRRQGWPPATPKERERKRGAIAPPLRPRTGGHPGPTAAHGRRRAAGGAQIRGGAGHPKEEGENIRGLSWWWKRFEEEEEEEKSGDGDG